MHSVLITGANRGIGLEFARQYADAGWDVVATARDLSNADELNTLNVRVEQLDIRDMDAVASFADRIDGALDLLIANAATNRPMNPNNAEDAKAWVDMLAVNSIAPYVLAKSLLPRIRAAHGKAIAISSGMGSIGDAGGGWIPYRTSKAALNMAWRSLSFEARPLRVTAVMLSPGWVKTRMGGAGAEITPQESVTAMRLLIDRLTIDDTGRFMRRDGSELPW